jgi:glycerophosphoryl diester phosphodiesterase
MQTVLAFEVQGHRGARGLKPENTLVGFEAAFDLGVSAIETDLHLSGDGVIVIFHDPCVTARLCSVRPGLVVPEPACEPPVQRLRLAQLRGYRVDRNPDPARFPDQDCALPGLACAFAQRHGIDPLGIPTLVELFAFAADYAGEAGRQAGKSPEQQRRARQVRFDLELKRVPFCPENIGDDFTGATAGTLERGVVAAVRRAGVLDRTIVRSFDHRAVRAVKEIEPTLRTGVLVDHTALVDPVHVAQAAGAVNYCPDYRFLDEATVRQLRQGGVRVLPWTVNRAEEWERLIAWGVDGLTTDFPDRLLAWLAEHRIAVL